MSYELKSSSLFLEQLKTISPHGKMLIESKLDLIKQNPFRFKRIHSRKFSQVFRIRLNLDGKDCRLIFVILNGAVILVCILERKNDYRELEGMLRKI
ncbi:MAG: hypothetical protein ABIG96_01060 [Candidatus Micrarchaeota archaeon]